MCVSLAAIEQEAPRLQEVLDQITPELAREYGLKPTSNVYERARRVLDADWVRNSF